MMIPRNTLFFILIILFFLHDTVSAIDEPTTCATLLATCQKSYHTVPLTAWSNFLQRQTTSSPLLTELHLLLNTTDVDFPTLADQVADVVSLQELQEAAQWSHELRSTVLAVDTVTASVNAQQVVTGFFDQIAQFFILIWDSIVLKFAVLVDIVVLLYNLVLDIFGVFGQYFRDLWQLMVDFWEGLVYYFTYHMRRPSKKTLEVDIVEQQEDQCREELIQCQYDGFLVQTVPKVVATAFLAEGVLNLGD